VAAQVDDGLPFFGGVGAFLSLLYGLATRRGRADARRALPILWLVRAPHGDAFLGNLSARLHAARDPIPHALVDCANLPTAELPPRLPVLHLLYEGLREQGFNAGGIPFRHYELAHWLTQQRLPPGAPPGHGLQDVLGQWRRNDRLGIGDVVAAHLPMRAQLPLQLARIVLGPEARLRLWASGRVPGSGQPRWFFTQRRHLPLPVMRNAISFRRLAELLTIDDRPDPAREYAVQWLLVSAFLRDLRLAYRRRPWRVLPWRRTANVLALFEDISVDNGGVQLIDLVGAVRAKTRDVDPLLIVAASPGASTAGAPPAADPPPAADAADAADALPAADAADAYERWQAALAAGGDQSGQRWQLRLLVPAAPAAHLWPAIAGTDRSMGWKRPLAAPAWPVLTRRRVLWPVLLLVVALLAGGVTTLTADRQGGCSSSAPDVSVALMDGECVGYSAGPFVFSADDASAAEELVPVQKAIFQQNRCAESMHADGALGTRRLVTLIYFAALTAPKRVVSLWDAAEVAELEGLLTWQRYQNGAPDQDCRPTSASDPNGPLLRVVVANGGSEMHVADQVTDRLATFAKDPSENVLGVIGLDRSVAAVEESISELGEAGIPAVATTLSGDNLARLSPLYLQISPPNTRQALLVAKYAVQHGNNEIDVYFPGASCGGNSDLPFTSDSYIYTLVHDLRYLTALPEFQALAHQGPNQSQDPDLEKLQNLKVRLRTCETVDDDGTAQGSATAQGAATTAGQDPATTLGEDCADGHLLFYAARYDHFPGFLEDARSTDECAGYLDGSQDAPRLIADDSVTRYVLEYAGQYGSKAVFGYVSKGPASSQAGPDCLAGKIEKTVNPDENELFTPLRVFCTRLHDMYETYQSPASIVIKKPVVGWADERVALAYDAASLFIEAASNGRHTVPKVMDWIRGNKLNGVTGPLDFTVNPQVGDAHQMAILGFNTAPSETGGIRLRCDYLVSESPAKFRPCPSFLSSTPADAGSRGTGVGASAGS